MIIIILYDCWDQVGVACLGFLNTSQTGGYCNFFLNFCLYLIFAVILKGVLSLLWSWLKDGGSHFGPLQTNCLFKRLENTTISITRLQCYCNTGLCFYFFLRTLLTDSSHKTNHFYHLKKVEGHTEHKQLKRNVTRTLFLYMKR